MSNAFITAQKRLNDKKNSKQLKKLNGKTPKL